MRNFADSRGHGGGGAGGGRAIIGAHTHPNPEALSPDGVFLPPLPTEVCYYYFNFKFILDEEFCFLLAKSIKAYGNL